jgi:hypothetical protein
VFSSFSKASISKAQIEKTARDMGMMYPDDIKAYFSTDKK